MGMVREVAARDHLRGDLAGRRASRSSTRPAARRRTRSSSPPTPRSPSVRPRANSVATARLWIIYRTGARRRPIPTQTVTVREAASRPDLAGHHRRQHRRAQDRRDRAGAGPLRQHERGPRRRADQARVAAAGGEHLRRRDARRRRRRARPLQPGRAGRCSRCLPLGAGGLSGPEPQRDQGHHQRQRPRPARARPRSATASSRAAAFWTRRRAVRRQGAGGADRRQGEPPALHRRRRRRRSTSDTYAIGLGTPQNTSAPALQTISGNNGGFLLVTGAITSDNRFLLQKYFLQILAGISNAEVVLDPDGELVRGGCTASPSSSPTPTPAST